MGSLKEALLKAGLGRDRSENDRQKRHHPGPIPKNVRSQQQRNFCEVCEKTLPDVERYQHRNQSISAQWICVACADFHLIDDRFRKTSQSDFSRAKRFRRFYGKTRA